MAHTCWSRDCGKALIKAVTSAILLLLAAAALVLHSTNGPLPLAYFMLVSVATAAVLIEVFFLHEFGRRESVVTLLQVSAIMVFSRVAEIFRFATIPGYDTYAHRVVVRTLLETGHVDLSLQVSSAAFPAVSILLTQCIQFAGTDERTAFAIGAMVGIVAIVLLFVVARLFIDARWAMVAAVVLSSAPFFKWWTEVEISPSTVGIVLAFAALYALLKDAQGGSSRLRALGVVSVFGLVISHPILTLFVLAILVCANVAQLLGLARHVRNQSVVGPVVLMTVVTLAYWMYLSQVWEISIQLFSSVLAAGTPHFPVRPVLGPSLADRIWGDLPWAIMLVAASYSAVAWVRHPVRTPLKTGWTMVCAGVTTLSFASISVGGDLAVFGNRWLLLVEASTSLLFANSIRALVSRKGRLWPVIAIGTITVLIASSSISPYVSLYQWGFHPILAFSDGQAIGMSFQTKCTQTIVADSYSATYLHFTYNRSTADLYGYSIGLPLNSTGVCILAQTESNIVYTKTIQGATSLGVDSADFSPGITELPVGFQSRLASTWGLQKVYDDGDTGWYLEN